jgi:hypothetical protein
MIVYGGFIWMTGGRLGIGGKEAIEEAKKIIRNAILGLVVILLAYLLVQAIIMIFTRGVA